MSFRVALYSPDRAVVYDGRTPDQTGVGGGITARLSLVGALAALGHDVTAYVNCRERIQHAGVTYVPLDDVRAIDTDVFIAMSTGGDLSFAPLRAVDVRARLRMIWVQGVPKPADLEAVGADCVVTASRFLRDVCVERWGWPYDRVVPCYNGVHQARFEDAETQAIPRDPFALAYIGPPEKGLLSAIEVLRRLRAHDVRYRLDVFGGGRLWGQSEDGTPPEPGVGAEGLIGQAALVPRLFEYEYCLAPQAMEEGFGIAVQEAKRAGEIVLASRVGAFGELIRDDYDGFLIDEHHESPASHDRMAQLVLELAADPRRRARVRRRAIETSSSLSWTRAAREWTDLIDARLHHRRNRILVGGYYGHGNLGDEAILQAMLAELRREMPSLQVTVASGNPAETRAVHWVDAVHERDLPALIEAAERSDAVVLGGGGLFQDYFGLDVATTLSRLHWGLTLCGAFPLLAALHHRPFAIYGVGVGPLDTPDGQRYTRLIFERASAATVRDPASADLLRAIGVQVETVGVTADPAFLLESAPAESSAATLAELGLAPAAAGFVAVALRAWDRGVDSDAWQAQVAEALDRVAETAHLAVVFVPFQATSEDALTDDRAVSVRVRDRMRHREAAVIAPSGLSPADVQGLFAASTVVLAMRLHGVILAANAGAPVMALAYDAKVRAAMRQLGIEQNTIDLESVTADALAAGLAALHGGAGFAVSHGVSQGGAGFSPPKTGRAEARPSIDRLRAAARQNTARLVALLRQGECDLPAPSPDWIALTDRTLLERARYAEVMETRADDLAIRLKDGAAEVERLAARSETLTRQRAAQLQIQEERDQQVAALSAEVAGLQIDVGRWPVRTYLRARRAARLAVRRLLVAPVKHVVRAAARRLMNGPSYVFDRFKRARMATYGADFAGLRAPGEPALVSIVLPVYNGAALVNEAIDSILGQTYATFELIIIDDGSTDGTAAIVDGRAAADPRIRVVHQENRKLPQALSRGFRLARGEFVTWTSADNRLKPMFLEKMVACLTRHPSWDMAYANLDVIGENGGFWRGSSHYEGYQRPPGSAHVHLPETTAELNVVANNSVGAAFLYRRRVPFLVGDYSPHRFIMEDYDYWMRVNALMTLRHADFTEPIYDYRFHRRSLTARWEEFDMLGQRDGMMVFDDFRRDFFLLPMVWVIDGPATHLGAALATHVHGARHIRHAGQFPIAALPHLSVPLVYARTTSDPAGEGGPPGNLPPGMLKVLITDAPALPNRMHDEWDLCVAIGAVDAVPALASPFQGWLAAIDMATLFQAVDARAKSAHLARFETEVTEGRTSLTPAGLPAVDPPAPKASVIICTRRWSERLERTLRAVAAQKVSDAFEVILVDNRGGAEAGSWDTAKTGAARVVVCPIPGLSAARNAGLAEARGEIVCFLDDDALPAPDWLHWICAAFAEHRVAVVGGHIRLKMPATPPRALRPGWRKYWSEFLTEHHEYTEVEGWGRYPWGANWSARRDALMAIGGFRSRYGRTGANYWGGEEMVAACLIQRLGGTIAVEPRASVLHDVDPARFTLSHVFRTMVAGYQVYHRAQHDLYVPRQDRVVALLRRLRARDFDRDVGYGRLRWVDAALRKYAQAGVIVSEIADLGRRAKRPVASENDPGRRFSGRGGPS